MSRANVVVEEGVVRVITVGIQGPPGVGISQGYVDAGDAASRQRGNHTGTQPSSTISDFATAADARIAVQRGFASGLATLDSNAKIPTNQLPALAITDTFVVASQAAMLALTAEVGDTSVRTDLSKTYILKTAGASTLANWQELLTPTDTVLSVNGQTGAVTGLAPLASPAFTGIPTGPTAALGTNTTQLATTAFVGAAVVAGTPDATSSVKGKVQLTGDLGGTASSPLVRSRTATTTVGPAGSGADMECDGTADQVQINAAILLGGRVVLRKGTYNTSGSITMASDNVILEGEGHDTLINKTDFNGNIFNVTGENISVKDMKVNGNRATATWDNHGVYVGLPATNILIENLFVTEVVHHAINTTAYGITIRDCYVENCGSTGFGGVADGVGIIVGVGGINMKVLNCTTHNTGYHGIQVYTDATDVVIDNCHVTAPGQTQDTGSGVKINPGCTNVVISNSTFDGAGSGGNSSGIYVVSSPGEPVNHVQFANVSVSGFAHQGYELSGVTNVSFVGGSIFNNGQNASSSVNYGIRMIAGLSAAYETTRVSIVGTKIYDDQLVPTQNRAIGLYGGSTEIIVDDVDMYGHVTFDDIYKDAGWTGTIVEGLNTGGLGTTNLATGTAPKTIITETNTGSGYKRWETFADIGTLHHRVAGDDGSETDDYMTITRAGATSTAVNIHTLLQIDSTQPRLVLYDSNTGSSAKRWEVMADSATLHHRLGDDAGSTFTDYMTVSRSGMTPTGVAINAPFEIAATQPRLTFNDTDTGSNYKRWDWLANSGTLSLRLIDDADTLSTSVLSIARSGATALTSLIFPITSGFNAFAGHLSIGKVTAPTAALDVNGAIAVNSNKITDLAAPTLATDAANKGYVDNTIAALVDSSPATLDTLNELAAALGDDPDFAATTATNIASKLAKASNLSDLANAATARTNLGVSVGVDVQAHDADLDTIAALNSATAGVIASDGSGWTGKTYAAVKTALVLVKADVGLSNVDNTSDATKDAATATLTNKTLTTPKIAQISDSNGAAALTLTTAASAVNYLDITNAAASSGPILAAAGADSNVGITILSKGTGPLYVKSGTDSSDAFAIVRSGGNRVLRADTSNTRISVRGNTAPTSTLHSLGSFATAYAAKTSTTSVASTDSVIDCTSGTFTVTLPTAVGCTGREYIIKNSGTGVITVATTSSQTIDGSTTYSLSAQYKYVRVVSNLTFAN